MKFLLVTPPVLYAFWVFFFFILYSIFHVDIGDLFILLHHFQALSKSHKLDSENTLFLKSISRKEKKEKSKSNSKKQKNSEKYGINDLCQNHLKRSFIHFFIIVWMFLHVNSIYPSILRLYYLLKNMYHMKITLKKFKIKERKWKKYIY